MPTFPLSASLAALLVSCATSLSACNSPLFNHANASDLHPGIDTEAPTDLGACPLKLVASGYCAQIEWKALPNSHDPAAFTLRFWRDGESALSDPPHEVAAKLWMPAMGHGSSPVRLSRTGAGLYDVSEAYFVMPGDWDVHVQLKSGSDIVDEAVLGVRI
jgi:hypothetical protein